MARWETAERWYEAHILLDLFGEWSVQCCWGGKYSKNNGHRTHVVESKAAATLYIESLDKVRSKSNPPYQRVS